MLPSALALLLMGAACSKSSSTEGAECVDHGDCSEGEACFDDVCKAVDCLSSADCDIQQFCSPRFECQTGCEQDSDCLAGEVCNASNQCIGTGCRTTELDCSYGQVCNEANGQCVDMPGEWCTSCNPNNVYSCGNTAYCVPGWENPTQGYCLPLCPTEECARGFTCVDPGYPYELYCSGDCEFMVGGGYL